MKTPNTITVSGSVALLTIHSAGQPVRVTIDARDAGRVGKLQWSLQHGLVVSRRSRGPRGANRVTIIHLAQFILAQTAPVYRTAGALDYRRASLSLTRPLGRERKGSLAIKRQDTSASWGARAFLAGKESTKHFSIGRYGALAKVLAKHALKRLLGNRREKLDARRLGIGYAKRTGLSVRAAVWIAANVQRLGASYVARLGDALAEHGRTLLALFERAASWDLRGSAELYEPSITLV